MNDIPHLPILEGGDGQTRADAACPLQQAARCLEKINRSLLDSVGEDKLLDALEASLEGDRDSETMLQVQAHILYALFTRYAAQDIHRDWTAPNGTTRSYISREELDCALRVQRQCRSTLSALSLIRVRKRSGKTT